ncbi:MAG TPA: LysR family transcriptional regulator [Kofleriaceae bacterium]|nr:LysR family transcriptional regulator [Kofleriaceae bacterium]
MVNLAGIDLNLLVAFDALFAEANVTRAAKRVGLSQPAMSNALSRLRSLLSDPLFLRTPRGMAATPRARQLAAPIREALTTLQQAIAPARFDPMTSSRTFTISAPDSTEMLLATSLMERLAVEAPSVRLVFIRPRDSDPTEILDSERADIAIINLAAVRSVLRTCTLFRFRQVCIVRKDHPQVGAKMTLKLFTSLRHVMIAPYGSPGSAIDDRLAKLRTSRVVALRVASFATAPRIVAATDHLAILPAVLAQQLAVELPIRILDLPFDMPEVQIGQVWHPRFEHDEGHAWFRAVLTKTAAAAAPEGPRRKLTRSRRTGALRARTSRPSAAG